MFTQIIDMFTQYFKECQPFLLTFTTWFSKSWHRLNEPLEMDSHEETNSWGGCRRMEKLYSFKIGCWDHIFKYMYFAESHCGLHVIWTVTNWLAVQRLECFSFLILNKRLVIESPWLKYIGITCTATTFTRTHLG